MLLQSLANVVNAVNQDFDLDSQLKLNSRIVNISNTFAIYNRVSRDWGGTSSHRDKSNVQNRFLTLGKPLGEHLVRRGKLSNTKSSN